jgi:hypothetical protein
VEGSAGRAAACGVWRFKKARKKKKAIFMGPM